MKIALRSVVVEYEAGLPSATRALAGVDLDIGEAECVAIVGPTGSGKTTLLEVLAGLARPTAGSAGVESGDAGARLQSVVGLAYQFPESQFFEETVWDDVAFGPRRQGLAGVELESRVTGALVRAGLPSVEFAGRSPLSLSAGEKRRAAIACILALDRPFLLLDEPSAGLDPVTRGHVIDLILNEVGAGRGVVIVTHDLELADRVAGRTIVVSGGEILTDGETAAVFGDVAFLEGLGLTPPPRYVLVDRLKKRVPEEAEKIAELLLRGRVADGLGR